jgi:hypothetical protein
MDEAKFSDLNVFSNFDYLHISSDVTKPSENESEKF